MKRTQPWARRARSTLAAVALCVGAVALAPGAVAQQRDPAAAEALFRQGREAVDAGDYEEGCAKFRESHRLDPALGTLFNIADCEEKLGHLATAWTLFQEVIQRLPSGDDRRPIAKKRAAALEGRVPKLTITLGGEAPEGTQVRRNDVDLGVASLDTPLPVDPGKQTIEVSAPGRQTAVFEVTLAEGQSESLAVEVGPPADPGTEDPAGASVSTEQSSPTLGYVVGGIGVAGLVVGGVTGVMVLGKKSTVDDNCDANKICNREGADAADAGRTLGTVSTIGFVVGAVGVGLGAYLVLSSDNKEQPRTMLAPAVAPDGGRVSFLHRF